MASKYIICGYRTNLNNDSSSEIVEHLF